MGRFGNEGNVIDIGIQPLWLPGVIKKVMRHDTILKAALAEGGMEIRFHSLSQGRRPMMISELKGKRIAYGFGSQAHCMLLEILAGQEHDPDDVRMISIDEDSMPDALYEYMTDAFAAWEPTPTIALTKYPEFVVVGRGLAAGIKTGGETGIMAPELFSPIVIDDLLGISASAFLPEKDKAKNGGLFREFHFLQEIGEVSGTAKWEDVTSGFDFDARPGGSYPAYSTPGLEALDDG